MMDLGMECPDAGPSAFLASAALTHTLEKPIFPDSIKALEDESVKVTEERRLEISKSANPAKYQEP